MENSEGGLEASFELDFNDDVRGVIASFADRLSFVNLSFCNRKYHSQFLCKKKWISKSGYIEDLGASNSLPLLLDAAVCFVETDFSSLLKGVFIGGNRQFLEFALDSPLCESYSILMLLRSLSSKFLREVFCTFYQFALAAERLDFLSWFLDRIRAKGSKIDTISFPEGIWLAAISFKTVEGLKWCTGAFPVNARIGSAYILASSISQLHHNELENEMLRVIAESWGPYSTETTALHTQYKNDKPRYPFSSQHNINLLRNFKRSPMESQVTIDELLWKTFDGTDLLTLNELFQLFSKTLKAAWHYRPERTLRPYYLLYSTLKHNFAESHPRNKFFCRATELLGKSGFNLRCVVGPYLTVTKLSDPLGGFLIRALKIRARNVRTYMKTKFRYFPTIKGLVVVPPNANDAIEHIKSGAKQGTYFRAYALHLLKPELEGQTIETVVDFVLRETVVDFVLRDLSLLDHIMRVRADLEEQLSLLLPNELPWALADILRFCFASPSIDPRLKSGNAYVAMARFKFLDLIPINIVLKYRHPFESVVSVTRSLELTVWLVECGLKFSDRFLRRLNNRCGRGDLKEKQDFREIRKFLTLYSDFKAEDTK